MHILSRDSLRQIVERTSEGKMTVLYDNNGNPNFMNIIYPLKYSDIFSQKSFLKLFYNTDNYFSFLGIQKEDKVKYDDYLPCFKVIKDEDGTVANVTRDSNNNPTNVVYKETYVPSEIFIGIYKNSLLNNKLVSMPNIPYLDLIYRKIFLIKFLKKDLAGILLI